MKTEEVKEITPEVLVEEDLKLENEGVEMVTPEIMSSWAEKEKQIKGVEMVTPEIMSSWAKKEREIEEEEEKEIKVEKFELSIIQSLTKEKKEIRKKQIEELKKPLEKKSIKLFTQYQYDPFVDMPCKKLVCKSGDKYCKQHLNPKCFQTLLTGKSCNKQTNIPGECYCNEHREDEFVIPEIISKDQMIKPRRTIKLSNET